MWRWGIIRSRSVCMRKNQRLRKAEQRHRDPSSNSLPLRRVAEGKKNTENYRIIKLKILRIGDHDESENKIFI